MTFRQSLEYFILFRAYAMPLCKFAYDALKPARVMRPDRRCELEKETRVCVALFHAVNYPRECAKIDRYYDPRGSLLRSTIGRQAGGIYGVH